jgi:hypothetical protein
MIQADYFFVSERAWVTAECSNSATKFAPGNSVWTENKHSVVGVIEDPNIAFFHNFEVAWLREIALAKSETSGNGSPRWGDQPPL